MTSAPEQNQGSVAETPLQGLVPLDNLMKCIHCGLCTSSCPTYLETRDENDSPRGRIYLMRAVEEGRLERTETVDRHLDLCLDCRSCETACPSGVQYGQLIEQFRIHSLQRSEGKPPSGLMKVLLREVFPDRTRLARLLWPARLMQVLGLDRLAERLGLNSLLPTPLQRMQRMLPQLGLETIKLPDRIEAKTRPPQKRVGLFLGCVSDAMFRHQHAATLRVLEHANCDVHVPHEQVCCGAIEFHAGMTDRAVDKASRNIEAFPASLVDVVVTNIAGCGAMLKEYGHLDEYGSLTEETLERFSGRVQDIHELLMELKFDGPFHPLPVRVVYQDACHLRHAQKVVDAPRELLSRIPELEILEITESNICCGAAGSYNLSEPEMSDRLGNRKVDQLIATKPDLIASGNVGCALQIQAILRQRGISIPVVHPVELLDRSLSGQPADFPVR